MLYVMLIENYMLYNYALTANAMISKSLASMHTYISESVHMHHKCPTELRTVVCSYWSWLIYAQWFPPFTHNTHITHTCAPHTHMCTSHTHHTHTHHTHMCTSHTQTALVAVIFSVTLSAFITRVTAQRVTGMCFLHGIPFLPLFFLLLFFLLLFFLPFSITKFITFIYICVCKYYINMALSSTKNKF